MVSKPMVCVLRHGMLVGKSEIVRHGVVLNTANCVKSLDR